MWISAAVDLWQRAIASPPGASWYAPGPPASVIVGERFVLPAQRPPSPAMYESPRLTIQVSGVWRGRSIGSSGAADAESAPAARTATKVAITVRNRLLATSHRTRSARQPRPVV